MEAIYYVTRVKNCLLNLDSYTQKSKDIYEKIIISIGFERASSIIDAIHNNRDFADAGLNKKAVALIKQYINNHQEKKACYKSLGELNEHRLYNAIIRIIYDEIDNLSLEGEINIHYIIEAIDILNLIAYNDKSISAISGFFNDIHQKLLRLLAVEDFFNNKECRKAINDILNKLEKNTSNYNYKEVSEQNKNLEAILYFALFDLKDFAVFSSLLTNYNKAVNMVGKNNNPLIKKVIYRYLASIKRYTDDKKYSATGKYIIDLNYYLRVLTRIINDKGFKITDSEKENYIKMIDDYIENLDFDNEKKGKVDHYVNNVKDCLRGYNKERTPGDIDYEYGIERTFGEQVNKDADALHHFAVIDSKVLYASSIPDVNINEIDINTFDHEPNEIDDATSAIEKDGLLIAGVHIADPTPLLLPGDMPFNSSLFNEARKRVESIYFEDGTTIPMLPNVISKDLMSLNAGQYVNAINSYYYFDKVTGTLVDQKITAGVIRVNRNLDYVDFGQKIKEGKDENLARNLENMQTAANFMARTGLYKSDIISELANSNSKSAQGINVVTNYMIFNNVWNAKTAKENGTPFIFRNHKLDEGKDKRDNLKKKVLSRDPITSIFRLLEILDGICPNAKYSSTCLGHDTLESEYYSHTTSPLRRFVDILNILCIKKFIINQDYTDEDVMIYTEYICMLIEEINQKIALYKNYMREIDRHEKKLVLC